MLILSRKESEEIVIGEGESQIVVSVQSIRGDRVRIGVVAPKTTSINRREIHDLKYPSEATDDPS